MSCVLKTRQDERFKRTLNLCAFGYGLWVPESRCANCSRQDDPQCAIWALVNRRLRARIVYFWNREPCAGCGGTFALTVDAALTLLKQRDPRMAEDTLVLAVERGGMSTGQAISLAEAHFGEAKA